jgi:uncharacterized delta-60 repeat protein
MRLSTHAYARAKRALVCVFAVAIVASIAVPLCFGASSTTTVSVTVPTAVYLSIDPADTPGGNCLTGAATRTVFTNPVLLNTKNTTAADCNIVFGSSNNTAMIRVAQRDAFGKAMWRMPTTKFDGAFGGGDGHLEVDVASAHQEAFGSAIAPDGDVVVVGNSYQEGQCSIIRVDSVGGLDLGFGGGTGKLTVANCDRLRDIVFQADGKFIVVGGTNAGDFLVRRYNGNGSPDDAADGDPGVTWDGDGLATVDFAGGGDWAAAAILQADGKIVVAGESDQAATWPDVATARLTATGALDTNSDSDPLVHWDGDGKRVDDPTGTDRMEDVRGIAMQSDGRIIVSGTACCDTNRALGAWRYSTQGVLDAGFGAFGGQAIKNVGAGSIAEWVVVQSNDRIVLGGSASTAGDVMYVARFTAGGLIDNTFSGGDGSDGYLTIDPGTGNDYAEDGVLFPDDSIMVVGETITGDSDSAAFRIGANGAIDTTYQSGNGVAAFDVDPGDWDVFRTASLAPDGRLLAAGGHYNNPVSDDYVVYQWEPWTVDDYNEGAPNDDWENAASTDLFGACLRAISNGASVAGGGSWAVDAGGDCATVSDTNDDWYPITTSMQKIAHNGSLGDGDATVHLRFGFRTLLTQPAGTYIAPLAFEVVAPNA